jgi:choline dehydrogenase-like flavoprotein
MANAASATPVACRSAPHKPAGRRSAPRRGLPDCVTLAPRCVVTRVINGSHGRVTGVEYRTYDDPATPASRPDRAEADIVVVAAHSIENARLLLASGLGNGSGELGRNLMDHPTLLAWALAPRQIGPFRGPGSTSGWEAFRFGEARRIRAPFRIEIGNWGWVWATFSPISDVAIALGVGGDSNGSPKDPTRLFGETLRHALGDQIGRQLQLQFAMEQPADPNNRVTIDDRYRDAMGNPRPILTYNLSDHVKEGMAAAMSVASAIYKELGAKEETNHSPRDGVAPLGYFHYDGCDYAFSGAGHGAGTHIMGENPTNSVVDSFQRCWDHSNLYAVGCGSMPSVGTSNPSLTMAALALRSTEQIHRDLVELHRPANLGGGP